MEINTQIRKLLENTAIFGTLEISMSSPVINWKAIDTY